MGYDRGDSFPFDFEPNGIPLGSKLKGKLSPRSYPIKFERKWNTSFLSAHINRKHLFGASAILMFLLIIISSLVRFG